MAKLSRRGALALVAAGVGEIGALAAAAAAGAYFTPVAMTPPPVASGTKSTTEPRFDVASEPLAAFVPDAQGDTIVIMRNDKETIITDPELVRALISFSSSL